MRQARDGTFALLFMVMLTIAAGNTALQSVLPALGRSMGVRDNAVAAAFSVSALLWVIAAPLWLVFGIWMMAIQYIDYPADNNKMS